MMLSVTGKTFENGYAPNPCGCSDCRRFFQGQGKKTQRTTVREAFLTQPLEKSVVI